jgi:hypothetical protein
VIYRLIDPWQRKANMTRPCRLLAVSRSGFYSARHRRQAPPAICSDSV